MAWSEEDFKAAQERIGRAVAGKSVTVTPSKPAKKRNKYGAKRVQIDGIWFDSLREGERYGELKLLEKAGAIRNLKVHPRWELTVNDTYIGRYTADFCYQEAVESTGEPPARAQVDPTRIVWWMDVVEDVKSEPTAKSREFRRTLKLMRALYQIEVKVVL